MACTGLVGASFYVQHVLGVEPCPLCIIQRFTYLALAIVFLAPRWCVRTARCNGHCSASPRC
jgi:disulfide bond formation protein DsbB